MINFQNWIRKEQIFDAQNETVHSMRIQNPKISKQKRETLQGFHLLLGFQNRSQ